MRYKILFISSWFPNKLESTNGNFVQRHAEAASLLHDVEILHAIGDFHQKEKYIFDDKIVNKIRTLVVYYPQTKNPIQNFFRRMNAYKKGFQKMQKPNLVHANILQNNLFFAVWLKKKYHIPFVVSEHWSGFLTINRSKLSKINLWIAQKIAKKASYILPVSQVLKQNMQQLNIGKKHEVVENVINTKLFTPKKNQENSTFIFLHLSSLISLKNPDKIILAANRLRQKFQNFELHIGGDGDVQALNVLVEKLNANHFIKTFNEISYHEVSEKMQKSDCFVLFSDYESFSCVLLESVSSGTPVIATNVGAIPEIINEKCGIIIEKSEDDLYEAMKKMLLKETNFDSPEKMHQYVDENFSPIKIAEKFDTIYQSVLGKKGNF